MHRVREVGLDLLRDIFGGISPVVRDAVDTERLKDCGVMHKMSRENDVMDTERE